MANVSPAGGQAPPAIPPGARVPPAPGDGAAASFLALLARLGRDAADAASTGADATTPDGPPPPTDADALPPADRQTGRATAREGRRHAPWGTERAQPLLPTPIIIGVMPPAGQMMVWRAGAAPEKSDTGVGNASGGTGAGMQRGHPLLPSGGDAGTPAQGFATSADAATRNGALPASTSAPDVAGPLPGADVLGVTPPAVVPGNASPKLGAAKKDAAPSFAAQAAPVAGAAGEGAVPAISASSLPPAPQLLSVPHASPSGDAAFAPGGQSTRLRWRDEHGRDGADAGDGPGFAPTGSVGIATPGATAGATPPAAPPHPAAVTAAQEVALRAQLLGRGQSGEMRLRLRPPELGEVGVTLRRDLTGGLHVHLVPASPEAARVLGAHLSHLQTALEPHSQGAGAHVTLGQHDASGSSHGESTAQDGRPDPETSPATEAPTAVSSAKPLRTVRSAALDYDA